MVYGGIVLAVASCRCCGSLMGSRIGFFKEVFIRLCGSLGDCALSEIENLSVIEWVGGGG